MKVGFYQPHFTDEETVTLRGEIMCPHLAGVKVQHLCIFYSLIISNATEPDRYLIFNLFHPGENNCQRSSKHHYFQIC